MNVGSISATNLEAKYVSLLKIAVYVLCKKLTKLSELPR